MTLPHHGVALVMLPWFLPHVRYPIGIIDRHQTTYGGGYRQGQNRAPAQADTFSRLNFRRNSKSSINKAHTLHTWNQSLDHAPLYMRLILNLVRIRQGVSGSPAGGRVMSNLDTGHLICLLLLQRPCCPMAVRKLTGLADHHGSVVSRRIRGSKGPGVTYTTRSPGSVHLGPHLGGSR